MNGEKSASDNEERSPSSFAVSPARSPRVAGSLLFITKEAPITAIPAAVVKGSGATASATPAFLTVLLSEAGSVVLLRLRVILAEFRVLERPAKSRDILLMDSNFVRMTKRSLSCKIMEFLQCTD